MRMGTEEEEEGNKATGKRQKVAGLSTQQAAEQDHAVRARRERVGRES